MAGRILLVDDDDALREVLKYKLTRRGYETTDLASAITALELLRDKPFDLILSDIKMPKMSGVQLLDEAKKLRPDIAVILMTAFATIAQAVAAVKLGASDYLTKPFEDEQMFVAIEKALKVRNLESENRTLKDRLKNQRKLNHVVGVSRPFKEMMALVEKVAPSDATVLVTGESGVGKEVIARAIHVKSPRAEGEFIAVNCAAIPRDLIESELFGHVKGAFTGAVRNKKGKFELADGGTILLDEIGELSLELQAKLLRVMQERIVEPVGAEETREVDFRLIAATNVDLKSRVEEGMFREDLYYRLNVIPIIVPPLRERREDIPILANEFLKKYDSAQAVTISPELMETLVAHPWPGNIRELDNLIERMVILRSGNILTPADLPADFNSQAPQSDPPRDAVTFHEAEKQIIISALEKHGWNKSRAARFLDIPRHVLIYRMKKYGLHSGEKV